MNRNETFWTTDRGATQRYHPIHVSADAESFLAYAPSHRVTWLELLDSAERAGHATTAAVKNPQGAFAHPPVVRVVTSVARQPVLSTAGVRADALGKSNDAAVWHVQHWLHKIYKAMGGTVPAKDIRVTQMPSVGDVVF